MDRCGPDRGRGTRGQATPEYVGLILLVAAVLGVVITLVGAAAPGVTVARQLAGGLLCAFGVSSICGDGGGTELSSLEAAYGAEIAAELERRAPDIFFEDDDFVSLPVDFRDCRARSCADTIRPGSIRTTQTGLPPVAFTHVVDCRRPDAAAEHDCSGERSGNLYLQFWLYYPDSLTHGLGRVGGYHADDWESYQLRVGLDGSAVARASSHHGYNGRNGGLGSVGSDTGLRPRPGWDAVLNRLHVASGSHAGTTQFAYGDSRAIHRRDLVLIPAEPLAEDRGPGFAVTPPWEKPVWSDPEAMGT